MKLDIRVILMTIFLAALSTELSGCNDAGSTAANSNSAAGGSSPATVSPTSISGNPAAYATVGSRYEFLPTVSAEAGAELSFKISNQPSWAVFDPTTGKLQGTPTSADVGEYDNISIEVMDGDASAVLTAFSIAVKTAAAVAKITWETPAAESSPVKVEGYYVYYGASPSKMTRVDITDARDTSYVISNLAAGTWYFAMTSYDASMIESDRSATVMVTL